MRTPKTWTALSIAAVLALAGCSASGSDESTAADAGGGAADYEEPANAVQQGADEAAGADDRGADPGELAAPDSSVNLASAGREVITTGTVSMTVENPAEVVRDITRTVETAGGWVEELEQHAATEYEAARARMVVRIPSRDVSTTLDRLATYGTVDAVDINRTDVTMEVRDLQARIDAMEMSVERMSALLERANSTEDLLTAERMLTDRQAQLESLLSQQAVLADQVSMSTLTIQLWTSENAPEPEPEPATGFWAGLVNGWNSFYTAGSTALLVLGTLLPWLIFFALVTVVVAGLLRVYRARRPAPPSPGEPGGPTTSLPPHGAPRPAGHPEGTVPATGPQAATPPAPSA